MGAEYFQTQLSNALLTVLLVSAPALGAAIIVGVGVGLVQALTQIQDQTLPQAVKLVVVMLVLILVGPLLAQQVTELARQGLDQFPSVTRGGALMENPVPAVPLIQAAYPYLLASALAVARVLGVVMITPAFTRLGITGLLRSCIALAVAIPIVPPILETIVQVQGLSPLTVTGLMVKEVLVGGVIGLVFGIPFWAAETAGDIVDLQRGSTSSQLLDPISLAESSVTATLLTLAMLALFFTTGGFGLLADAVYRSYELWPVAKFTPVLDPNSALGVLKALDRLMQIAVMLVAPIMIALLAADLMLGYLSRLAPQIHVFDLSLSVKNLLFTFLMALYAVFLAPAMLTEVGALQGAFDAIRALTQGAAR